MPASAALPPLRKMASPASAARGWAATTICFFALTRGLCAKPLAPSGASKAWARRRSPLGPSASRRAREAPRIWRKACVMRRSIAGLAWSATGSLEGARLMEVAGLRDHALGSGVAARVPARMEALVWRWAPRSGLGTAHLVGMGKGEADCLAPLGEQVQPLAQVVQARPRRQKKR